MSPLTLFIVIGAVVLLTVLLIWFFAKQYRKVGPNEILIISGGKKGKITLPDGTEKEIGFRFRIGGGTFVNPFFETVERLPIEVIPIHGKISEVMTNNSIPVTVEYAAQVRIDTSDYALYLAITNFLSKGTEGIKEVSETVLEGKVRELIGQFTVEELLTHRSEFVAKVAGDTQEDFNRLGLVLMSFGLNEVADTQGYLEALSRPHITEAKYQAEVDQAEKNRDITIRTAKAKKEGEIARLQAEAEIAKINWQNEALKSESQVEVNRKKAQADMSYELERYRIQQELKKEEFKLKHLEMDETIKLEEMNIRKKQKELEANVIKPAEARKQQIKTEAEAESFRIKTESVAKLEARIAEDRAEAEKIRMMGKAEADNLQSKAKAFENYNQAAIYQMVLEKMPELASAISEPLSKVDKIVMIEHDGKLGTSKLTGQVADILSQLPEVIEALTGADIKKFLRDKLSDNE
ncbi:MAG: flotillin [Calditrichaeota bacterium]|nr:flotillin [Calditrichota bacterium]